MSLREGEKMCCSQGQHIFISRELCLTYLSKRRRYEPVQACPFPAYRGINDIVFYLSPVIGCQQTKYDNGYSIVVFIYWRCLGGRYHSVVPYGQFHQEKIKQDG
jgi:hypothetical protein